MVHLSLPSKSLPFIPFALQCTSEVLTIKYTAKELLTLTEEQICEYNLVKSHAAESDRLIPDIRNTLCSVGQSRLGGCKQGGVWGGLF